MSGLRFESMADMPPRMRELYAKQARDLSGAAAPALLAKESQDIRQLAGSAAMMMLLREPEGCDSQPGASPWARAARILPAAMSIPGRQARYSFPPRHSFRALQWTARKRSLQASRLIPHFFGQRHFVATKTRASSPFGISDR